VLGAESDGWFWDTEVMARAVLSGLKVLEVPVLFMRRSDVTTTVRLIPDSIDYMKELWRYVRKLRDG